MRKKTKQGAPKKPKNEKLDKRRTIGLNVELEQRIERFSKKDRRPWQDAVRTLLRFALDSLKM